MREEIIMPRVFKSRRFIAELIRPLNRQALKSRAKILTDRARNASRGSELNERDLANAEILLTISGIVEAELSVHKAANDRLWRLYGALYEVGQRMKDAALMMGVKMKAVSQYNKDLILSILSRLESAGFTVDSEGTLYRNGEPVSVNVIPFRGLNRRV